MMLLTSLWEDNDAQYKGKGPAIYKRYNKHTKTISKPKRNLTSTVDKHRFSWTTTGAANNSLPQCHEYIFNQARQLK